MRKFLIAIGVIQVKIYSTDDMLGNKVKISRVNPYNPLSYVVVLITLVMALFWIGINGIIENSSNPFKWQ